MYSLRNDHMDIATEYIRLYISAFPGWEIERNLADITEIPREMRRSPRVWVRAHDELKAEGGNVVFDRFMLN